MEKQAVTFEEDLAEPADIREIMARIRKRVENEVDSHKDQLPRFNPASADPESKRKAGEILYSEELRFLNQRHADVLNSSLDQISSHRSGVVGKLIVKTKRKFLAWIWENLLRSHAEEEREYRANLVRLLNDFVKYVDERDASNFWEIIRKIDVDVTRAIERIERISDEQSASLRSSERRMYDAIEEALKDLRDGFRRLDTERTKQDARLQTVESVSSGLESIVARIGKSSPQSSAFETEGANSRSTLPATPDFSYLLLENRFRGSEEAIKEHLKFYSELFNGSKGPIVEVGSGRGELLELFKEAGIEARGIDVDSAMVEVAQQKGLSCVCGDGLVELAKEAESSLAGVVAIQVVEHLTRKQLEEFFEVCKSKVKPGGKVVFETIDPRSLLALSSNYFRDPTHVWPMHPDTLGYQLEMAGLKVDRVVPLSPVSEQARLQPIPETEFMTPRWKETVSLFNKNIEQLNELLYGHQDYCIIAEVV